MRLHNETIAMSSTAKKMVTKQQPSSSSSSGIPVKSIRSNMAGSSNRVHNNSNKKTIVTTKPPLVVIQRNQRCTSPSRSSSTTTTMTKTMTSARIIRNSMNTTSKSNTTSLKSTQPQRSTSTVTITKTKSTIRTAIAPDKSMKTKNVSAINKSKIDTQRLLHSKSKQAKMTNESHDAIIKCKFPKQEKRINSIYHGKSYRSALIILTSIDFFRNENLEQKHRLIMDLCKRCRNIKMIADNKNDDGNFDDFLHTMDILLQLQVCCFFSLLDQHLTFITIRHMDILKQ